MSTNGTIDKEIFNEREESREGVYSGMGASFFRWATAAGEVVSPWWSPARDEQLRNFVKNSDHISGTVNTLRDMMTAIPVHVRAKDASVKSHVRQANQLTDMLMDKTESRGNTASIGWGPGFGAFVDDFNTTDNGAIFAIEGPGRPEGPLTGSPVKLIHLDSLRCQRTGHREYPILYQDQNGKRYKLHRTRVVVMSSMASSIQDMYGVGFCAVSRCINNGQVLTDIGRYKQEKLGSRPRRGMIVAEGATPKEVQAIASTLEQFNEMMDNRGLTRYTLIPVVGSKGPLSLLDTASLPDGFDELQSTQLSIAAIALAFGVDMRQLAYAFGVAGQTKADAEVQHAKMQGKMPGYILEEVCRQFNAKVLPPHLYLEFDYQDDSQDRQQAEINKVRAEGRKIYLDSKTIDTRTARQQMVETGELDESQYIDLELNDGRLEDGSPVESLFYLNDRDIQAALNGIDPDNPNLDLVRERLAIAWQVALNAPTSNLKDKGRMVSRLLEKILGEVEEQEKIERELEEARIMANQSPPGQPQQLALPEPETKERDVPGLDDYQRALTRLIEKGQEGAISRAEFEQQVEALTTDYLTAFFLDAAGLTEDELDEAGQIALQGEIAQALEATPGLAEDTYSGGFIPVADGGRGNDLAARVGLWGGNAAGVYYLGQTFKGNDPYLEWERGGTKEPCADCIRLEGQVHKASDWRKSGWWPQNHSLECKGYRCKCSFKEVKGPEKGSF